MPISGYYDPERVRAAVREGDHRGFVGGMWDEIGKLQFDYLVGAGLTPESKLLDIGCGCLRGGVRFVAHLEPGNYYGVDLSEELLDAGYDRELADAGLQGRLPRENLLCDEEFSFDRFGVQFDMAIAQSVFTHLPLNHIRVCLAKLAPAMRPGGRLFATVFPCGPGDDWLAPIRHHATTSHPMRDPYHYRDADLDYAASDLPWALEPMRGWGHPRGQAMVVFTRTP